MPGPWEPQFDPDESGMGSSLSVSGTTGCACCRVHFRAMHIGRMPALRISVAELVANRLLRQHIEEASGQNSPHKTQRFMQRGARIFSLKDIHNNYVTKDTLQTPVSSYKTF